MHSSVIDYIHQRKTHYITKWKEDLTQLVFQQEGLSDDLTEDITNEMIDLVFDGLFSEEHEQEERLRRFADRLSHYGLPLSDYIRGLQSMRQTVKSDLDAQYSEGQVAAFEAWLDELISKLVDAGAKTQERVIDLQNVALKEMSAPLIPVFDRISVMPLIGTIDTKRAQQIMENLLEGIIEFRTQVVLIDITGVPVVDTMVAQHIIKVSKAVGLVGSKCIIVGIRPEIAQTIVNLGIDLSKFSTTSNLKEGVETALAITQREITPLSTS
ncbi:STAS domain-containing protein [Natribacillus halophilus]|uniref:RsbT co-antagonist protein RsbR n=1 Tax=Natribacillus halophilus TaxID=549003 RepID=A0A1G8QIU5_9BACI|nr:STAS domain-containing protein [Natribacillus halophilus]SDJ04719.1 rsbT co-antagonist protein RsbR [Natribacillus halophilus]